MFLCYSVSQEFMFTRAKKTEEFSIIGIQKEKEIPPEIHFVEKFLEVH